jgi:hypothetical protein
MQYMVSIHTCIVIAARDAGLGEEPADAGEARARLGPGLWPGLLDAN